MRHIKVILSFHFHFKKEKMEEEEDVKAQKERWVDWAMEEEDE
jgi:hypothetical protein